MQSKPTVASISITPSMCSLSMDFMKGMLERFAAMDKDKDGYVTERDMAMFLGAPEDARMSAVFSSLKPVSYLQKNGDRCIYKCLDTSLNQQSDNSLTFCQYLCNSVKLSRPLLQDNQYMHRTFQVILFIR